MTAEVGSEFLVCPRTKLPLEHVPLATAERLVAGGAPLQRSAIGHQPAIGAIEDVLLRSDHAGAYPIVDGVPILLAPEMLRPAHEGGTIDTTRAPYSESYEEMHFYNEVADRDIEDLTRSDAYEMVQRAASVSPQWFPEPRLAWLDAVYDCRAQWDAYRHLAPVTGARTMQLGGSGIHAVKFLLAGAAESWLVTPMLGEARFARALAQSVGVAERLRCVVGIGEELPFADETFGRVYAGGCLHHMLTDVAGPEIARVLGPDGRFAAMEPWRSPLYGMGTAIFGKREVGVNCRPIDRARMTPLYGAFESVDVVHHGALLRYPLIALSKLGIHSTLATSWRLTTIDDRLSGVSSFVRDTGSSVAILGSKQSRVSSPR